MAFNFIKVTLLVACFATAPSVRSSQREADWEVQEEAHEVTSDGYNSSFANGSSAILAWAPAEFKVHFKPGTLGFTLSEDNQVVIEVVPNSVAENAGVKAGDEFHGFSSSTGEIVRDGPVFEYRLGTLGQVDSTVWFKRPGLGAEVGAVATAADGKPDEAESPPEQKPGQDLGYEVTADNQVIMVRGGSQAWKQGARAGDFSTDTGFEKPGQPLFSGVQLSAKDLELLRLHREDVSQITVASACKGMQLLFHPDKQNIESMGVEEANQKMAVSNQKIRDLNEACPRLKSLLKRLGTDPLLETELEVLVEGPMGVAFEYDDDLEKLAQGMVQEAFVQELQPSGRAEQLGIEPGNAATAFARVADGRNYFRFRK